METNPTGTDGFEFVEYTSPDPHYLRQLFERMGFPVTARHRSKDVTLHSQGDINFIINAEPGSFAQKRPFPEEWAGLTDDALSEVVGVPGAVSCHKNRFIAVFTTRDAAVAALAKWGLMRRH